MVRETQSRIGRDALHRSEPSSLQTASSQLVWFGDSALPVPGSVVVVAMSGGVDSSVAAAMLHAAGYKVIGVTLQLYDHGSAVGKKGSCCAGQDIHDARRVADHLGIPHYVLDYEQRFRTRVMDAFASSYIKGETPIPCVTCNSQIKFTELLDTARELGASMLATGHYVRRVDDADGPGLYSAVDGDRDQSYFLFNTSREQLAQLFFPIGHLPKPEVRRIAREMALPVADKSDSQDICFVPSGRYADVIEKLRPGSAEAGDIVHVDGRILGRHKGILNYTVGQRKGLGIAAADPLYVIRLDAGTREVIVGPRERLDVAMLSLRDVNWLGGGSMFDAIGDGRDIYVRVRSSQAKQAATLHIDPAAPNDRQAKIMLHKPEPGIAAGQACVFYSSQDGDARVLGGGFISRALSRSDGEKPPRLTPEAYLQPLPASEPAGAQPIRASKSATTATTTRE
jgi:tRNA-specific 2-thiouridylase